MKRTWLLILIALALGCGTWLFLHGWPQSLGGPAGVVGSLIPGGRRPASAPQDTAIEAREEAAAMADSKQSSAPSVTLGRAKPSHEIAGLPEDEPERQRTMTSERARESERQKAVANAQAREAEQRAAMDREAAARAQAEESERRAQAEQQVREFERQVAIAYEKALEAAKLAAAEKAAADAALAQAEASAERDRAIASARAREAAEKAEKAAADVSRQQSALDRQRDAHASTAAERAATRSYPSLLRQQLLRQFNRILETRDTARGLVVNMSDVLFDLNKYTLRPDARERLARISEIILAHPGLRLEVDAYEDSTRSDFFYTKLSDERADAVRTYLTGQGIESSNITAKSFSRNNTAASVEASAGRQQSPRVELVVSGGIIDH